MTEEPLRLLMICTANQCRSPLAEVIAQSELERRQVDAVVVSAGLLEGGMPAARGSKKVAAELGLDLSDHVSHQVDAETVDAADVIITMGASHVLEVTSRFPNSISKTLTLRELAAEVESVDTRAPLSHQEIIEQVAVACTRPIVSLLRGDLDIDDPIGMPVARFRRTGTELTELLVAVFDRWFPSDR